MTKIAFVLAAFGALGFGLAACSKPETQPVPAPAASADSNMTQMPASSEAVGPIQGVGTVTAVDASAGTVALDHEAINAINWPAMKMQFKVEDPMILKGVATGDHVAFELKSAKETGVVTMIKKQ